MSGNIPCFQSPPTNSLPESQRLLHKQTLSSFTADKVNKSRSGPMTDRLLSTLPQRKALDTSQFGASCKEELSQRSAGWWWSDFPSTPNLVSRLLGTSWHHLTFLVLTFLVWWNISAVNALKALFSGRHDTNLHLVLWFKCFPGLTYLGYLRPAASGTLRDFIVWLWASAGREIRCVQTVTELKGSVMEQTDFKHFYPGLVFENVN